MTWRPSWEPSHQYLFVVLQMKKKCSAKIVHFKQFKQHLYEDEVSIRSLFAAARNKSFYTITLYILTTISQLQLKESYAKILPKNFFYATTRQTKIRHRFQKKRIITKRTLEVQKSDAKMPQTRWKPSHFIMLKQPTAYHHQFPITSVGCYHKTVQKHSQNCSCSVPVTIIFI